MRRTMVLVALVLAALVLMGLAGCSNVLPRLEKAVEAAQVIVDDAEKVVEETQAAIAKLPPGDPVRVALEDKLKKVKSVRDEAEKYVNGASATIDAIKAGVVSPEMAAALGAVPYGSYVAILLSLGLALHKHVKASKFLDAFKAVVKSWQEVGPDLTKEEKVQAKAIQGPAVTQLVHEIKASL